MKKLLIVVMLFIMLILSGCPGGEETKKESTTNKKTENKIDEKVAKEFMDNYMRYMMAGNVKALGTFYSEEIKKKSNASPGIISPKPIGFKLEKGNNKEKNMEYSAHIYSAAMEEPYFSDDTYKYTIENKSGKLTISKIEKDISIELFLKERSVYKREGEKVKGEPIIKLDELPMFTTLRGSSETKYSVPRDSFGPCAIAPDGKSYIISSNGKKDSFIGAVSLEGAKQTFASQDSKSEKEKGGESGDTSGGEQSKQDGKGSEGGGNASVKPIDLFINTDIKLISFGPNGKALIVLTKSGGNKEWLSLYTGKAWDPVKTYMDKHFSKGSFSIVKAYFVEDNKFIFTLQPVKNATPEEQSLGGEWSYDLKEDKAQQIK